MDIQGIYLDKWSGQPRFIKDHEQKRIGTVVENLVLKTSKKVAEWNKVFQENTIKQRSKDRRF